jgi:hypothetical protein
MTGRIGGLVSEEIGRQDLKSGTAEWESAQTKRGRMV